MCVVGCTYIFLSFLQHCSIMCMDKLVILMRRDRGDGLFNKQEPSTACLEHLCFGAANAG